MSHSLKHEGFMDGFGLRSFLVVNRRTDEQDPSVDTIRVLTRYPRTDRCDFFRSWSGSVLGFEIFLGPGPVRSGPRFRKFWKSRTDSNCRNQTFLTIAGIHGRILFLCSAVHYKKLSESESVHEALMFAAMSHNLWLVKPISKTNPG